MSKKILGWFLVTLPLTLVLLYIFYLEGVVALLLGVLVVLIIFALSAVVILGVELIEGEI